MLTEGKVLDLLFRQASPERVRDILIRELRSDPEGFLFLKKPFEDGKTDSFLKSRCIIERRQFLDMADTVFRGRSEDEDSLLFRKLQQQMNEWEAEGLSRAGSYLAPLVEAAEKYLTVTDGEPVCKYGQALEWRDVYLCLGQDVLVTAYLAHRDCSNRTERKDFTWPVILRVENRDLYGILQKGLAENHNHLAGGTQSFQVTWCRMMNFPGMIRDELINFRGSNLFLKMHRGEQEKRLDKFDVLELAAFIRTILFRALHRDAFSGHAVVSVSEEYNYENTPFDGMTAFGKEYADTFILGDTLKDTVDRLRNAYGVRLPILGDDSFCLDYAMEEPFYNAGKNQNIRVVIGERSFLYRCIRACMDGEVFTDFEKELFYLYLVLQCNFRSEMIQNNDQTGFLNFKNYQDRKDDAWDATPYYGDAMCMALNNRLNCENITSLEGRMVPKPQAGINVNKVFRADLAKRFHDCNPESALDIAKYGFDPETDLDLLRDASWFYVFHYFKVPDDRKLHPEKFALPVCRHARHRALIARQTRGLADALRESPYFRSRVRGIDSASEEVFCRPEVFAGAFRFIDSIQKNWSLTDTGLLSSNPVRIHKTYHAGEDFLDIASGLRAIDEAIRFLHLEPGSRIGHALALGVDPEIHYITKHQEIITTRQDRLDDLVWILYRGKELGVAADSVLDAQLRREAKQLFHDIYGRVIHENGWDSSLQQYWNSMKLREDDPSLYRSKHFKAGMATREDTVYLFDKDNEELRFYREDPQVSGLYYYYQFGVEEGRSGNETCIIKVSREYIQLMRRLQDAMMADIYRRNLIIETNPSSNVLIGTFKDYCLHPVFRFNDRKLTAWKSTARPEARDNTIQLNVCINTDDLGVFDTNLEFEYALLYEALRKRMEQNSVPGDDLKENFAGSMGENQGNYQYSSHDILDYLDDLRDMGNRAVFPTDRTSK